jgi:glycosyltransferase involved in cell wall biosynthesis
VEFVTQTSTALQRLGVSVEILNLDPPAVSWGNGVCAIHRVGPTRTKYAYTPALTGWLRQNLRTYNVVIVNGIWRYHSARVARAASVRKVPYFLVPHGMLHPWLNRGFTAKQAKKTVMWLLFEWRTLRDAAAVIYSSEEERRVSRKSYRKYQCRETVLPFGTGDPPKGTTEPFLAHHPGLIGKRLFTFLGRLEPAKGCDLALRAFARIAPEHNDIHLVMAGPDRVGLRANLESLVCRLGLLDRVTWTGFLAGEMKWALLRASEVLLFPSHCESVGYSVIEALACSLPVLISNKVNSHYELLQDRCAIVDEDTVEGTIASLRAWLSMPEPAKNEMRANARRAFLTRYESTSAAGKLLDFLDSQAVLDGTGDVGSTSRGASRKCAGY